METTYGLFVSGLFHSPLYLGDLSALLSMVVFCLSLLYSILFIDPFADAILIP